MNLKYKILSYLNTKPNWDILTKIVFIYIEVCKTFSFDCKALYGNQELKEQIYQKRLDITQIKEFEIVCSTLAYILKDLLKEIGIEAEISYDVLPHVFLIMDLKPYKIKLEPMKNGYDLTRVKVENNLYGIIDLNKTEGFQQKIDEACKKIYGYGVIFTNESLKRLKQELIKMKLFRNDPRMISQFDDYALSFKIDLIQSLINYTKKVKRFDDSDRYFDYLNKKLMTEWEQNKIHKHTFWKKENNTWSILNLILLEYQNREPVCLKMTQEKDKYFINSIGKEEMNYYLDNYEGEIKGLYRGLMM